MIIGVEFKFAEIYENYYTAICSYINRTVNNSLLAEDLAQETFIKVLYGLKDFDESKKLAPWIFRIARNTCIDYFRQNRQTFELIDEVNCYDNEDNSPENMILNKEHRDTIKSILLKMSQKYRTAIILRDFDGHTYKEIASTLMLKEASARTVIRRGRKQFREAYSQVY